MVRYYGNYEENCFKHYGDHSTQNRPISRIGGLQDLLHQYNLVGAALLKKENKHKSLFLLNFDLPIFILFSVFPAVENQRKILVDVAVFDLPDVKFKQLECQLDKPA